MYKNEYWGKSGHAAKHFGVTEGTIRRWADQNRIESKRTPGNQRIYKLRFEPEFKDECQKSNYIYVRVSSAKQRDDLERQYLFLQDQFRDFKVIKDIGSGLNFKRKGFIKLMELIDENKVDTVIVASKDRLCRFGFDFVKWFCERKNVKLVVLDNQDKSQEEEFTEDILAVLQVFACRWNGKRKYVIKNKKNQIDIDINPKENSGEVE